MYLPDLQESWFPDVEVVRLVVDERQTTVEERLGCDHGYYHDCCEPEWEVFGNYLETFLKDSAASHYATTFRLQNMTPPTDALKHRFLYEVDMVSSFGKALQYRREYNTKFGAMYNVLYNEVDYSECETHGVSSPLVPVYYQLTQIFFCQV